MKKLTGFSVQNTIMKSLNEGVNNDRFDFPFPTLTKMTEGIQEGMFTTVCGRTGSGKKSFLDSVFLMNTLLDYTAIAEPSYQYSIIYFCNKSNWEYKVKKLVLHYLKKLYGMVIDVKSLDRSPDAKLILDEQTLDLVRLATDQITTWMDNGNLVIYEGTPRPIDVQTKVIEHYNKYGKCEVNSESFIEKFTPFNEDQNVRVQVIIESANRLKTESSEFGVLSDQGRLESRLSNFLLNCKQVLKTIVTVGYKTSSYVKFKSDAESKYSDAGPFVDWSNLVLGLFNPFREGYMDKYINYSTKSFITPGEVNRFRTISILQNDYGIDSGTFALGFLPECGYFFQLPDVTISDVIGIKTELEEVICGLQGLFAPDAGEVEEVIEEEEFINEDTDEPEETQNDVFGSLGALKFN